MSRLGTYMAYLLFVCLFASRIFAQGTTTTASIIGIVSEVSGTGLAGATVVAKHLPSGVIFGTTSRDDGRYTLQNVRVGGPYEVTVTFVGYVKYSERVEYLKLGQNFTLNMQLAQSNVQLKELTVVGTKDPILNSGRTGNATNVSTEQIQNLPTINRSFQDLAKLSPLFSSTGLSAAGRNNRLNNIQMDGTQYNDLFGLGSSGTPGGQANTNPISLDAVQEFQVIIAPYDVRQSGFTGGGLNAITRGGTNTLTGSIYYFNRNEKFVGQSTTALRSGLPEFGEYQTGFRLGGPIVEDQLFFFMNAEKTKRNEPTSNLAISGPNQIFIQSQVDSVRNRLISKYGYDPGSSEAVTRIRPSTKLFGRLDFNLDEATNITLRYNYVDASDDILPRTTSNILFADRNYVFGNKTNSFVLQWTSALSNEMANEFILGYTSIRDQRSVGKKFPSIWIVGKYNNIYAGTEEFSIANQLDQDILEFTDNFSYYLGDHVFTVGTHNEFYKFRNLFIRNFYGYYKFNSVTDFYSERPIQYQYRYALGYDPWLSAKFNAAQYGFYAQDEYTAMPNLIITAGLRVDIPVISTNPAQNDSVLKYFATEGYNTAKVPSGKLLFAPRLGFNYDFEGDKSIMFRGGVGLFTGRVPYVWISNQFSNTGVEFADITKNWTTEPDSLRFFITDPNKQPRAGERNLAAGATTEINLTAPTFKMPQLLRFNVGSDVKLPFDMVGSLDLIYSKTINDPIYQDINLKSQTDISADGRYRYTGRVATYFSRIMFMKNTSDGYQFDIAAQLQGQPFENVDLNLGYNYGIAKDKNSVTSSQAQSQYRYNPVQTDPNNPPLTTSNFELRHRGFLSLSYSTEAIFKAGRTSFTAYYNIQSGRPYSFIFSGDANGDGYDSNDLIYIPSDSADAAAKYNMSGADINKFIAYVNRNDYLKANKGKIAERNGAREPYFHQLDLRISQDITSPFVSGKNLQISLDIINVGNLLDRRWGHYTFVNNQTDTPLRATGYAAKKITATFVDKNDPFSKSDLVSRWQILLGLRLNF